LVPISLWRIDQRFVPGADLEANLTHLAQYWDVKFNKDMKAWYAKYIVAVIGTHPIDSILSLVFLFRS